MIKKDINVNDIFLVEAKILNSDEYYITHSICAEIDEYGVLMVDICIIDSDIANALTGSKWHFDPDDTGLQLTYLGNKETHPEYLL